MVDWCRWQSREAAEGLLLCFVLIEAEMVVVVLIFERSKAREERGLRMASEAWVGQASSEKSRVRDGECCSCCAVLCC